MGFDPFCHECEKENKRLLGIIEVLSQTLLNLTKKKPDNATFDVIFNNNKNLKIMSDVSLVLGTPKTGVFQMTDNKTGLAITTAVFANQAAGANSNPGAATFAIDPANPNSPVATPVAAGTGTIVFTTDATWTDPGDGSSQSRTGLSVTKNFSVIASADGASFDVVFP